MNLKIGLKLALKNFKKGKMFNLPFILSSSIMLSFVYIMVSLINNDYVNTRHKFLLVIIKFGIVIVMLISMIFILYANKFIVKRRNKEFAMYRILGLEKKHIRFVIFLEQLIMYGLIGIFSIIMGHALGNFIFLGLNKLIKEASASVSDYKVSVSTFVITLAFIGFIFILTTIKNSILIGRLSPVELMGSQKSGEGEPKSRYLVLAIGCIATLAGYFIALTIGGTLEGMYKFFVAVLLVIFGTYALYLSLGTIVFKLKKRNKEKYYIGKNFLFISGMLKRLKSSALSLGSITVISTAIIIALSTTIAIYQALEVKMDGIYSGNDYIAYERADVRQDPEISFKKIESKIDGSNIKKKQNALLGSRKVGDGFELLKGSKEGSIKGVYYLSVEPLSSYDKKLSLEKDEVGMSCNFSKKVDMEKVNLAGKEYKVRQLGGFPMSNIGVDSYYIVMPNEESFIEMVEFYKALDIKTNQFYVAPVINSVSWKGKDSREQLKEIGVQMDYKQELVKDNYEMNGGFIFLGVLISLIFIIGNVLVMYYKQLSEAMEDRDGIQAMKKVGLPDEMINQTAKQQIKTMFMIPIVVSVIHTLGASKMMAKLLLLFGATNYLGFLKIVAIVVMAFVLVYMLAFRFTAKMYYKIVR